jgi:hypothetical protein
MPWGSEGEGVGVGLDSTAYFLFFLRELLQKAFGEDHPKPQLQRASTKHPTLTPLSCVFEVAQDAQEVVLAQAARVLAQAVRVAQRSRVLVQEVRQAQEFRQVEEVQQGIQPAQEVRQAQGAQGGRTAQGAQGAQGGQTAQEVAHGIVQQAQVGRLARELPREGGAEGGENGGSEGE